MKIISGDSRTILSFIDRPVHKSLNKYYLLQENGVLECEALEKPKKIVVDTNPNFSIILEYPKLLSLRNSLKPKMDGTTKINFESNTVEINLPF